MKTITRIYYCLFVVMALACTSFSADQVPAHQAKQIADAAPAKARAVPTKPRRVLIWITPTDADGFDQLTTSMAKETFKKYARDMAAVEQVLQNSLLHWVVGYGSLCIPFAEFGGMHSIPYAIAANRHWPLFPKILGGTFTGHPWNEKVGITVDEPGHPLVAAFCGKDFRLADSAGGQGRPAHQTKNGGHSPPYKPALSAARAGWNSIRNR